jgi:hypothetical protein
MNSALFQPIRLDVQAELAHAMQRPGFGVAWDALEEYAALNALLLARQQAGLT